MLVCIYSTIVHYNHPLATRHRYFMNTQSLQIYLIKDNQRIAITDDMIEHALQKLANPTIPLPKVA